MFKDATETADGNPEWTSDNKDTEPPMGKSATTYAMYRWHFVEIIVWRPERCFIPSRERKDFRPLTKGVFSSPAISYYLPCFPWVKFHSPSWIIHERYFLVREGCTAPAPRGSTSHLLFISFLTKGNPSLIPPIEKCDLCESYLLNPRNEINGSHHGRTSSITSRDVNHEIFLL